MILALSLATDIGRGQPLRTDVRSCLLAFRLAHIMHAPDAVLTEAYNVALLRCAGCTAEAHLTALAFRDDLAFRAAVTQIDDIKPTAMHRFNLGYLGADHPPLPRAGVLDGLDTLDDEQAAASR